MHYYVTYKAGGKFKRVHCQYLSKRAVVDYEHKNHKKCIIFFQNGSIYDDYFKKLTGLVWRHRVEQKFGIDDTDRFDKLDKLKNIEEEWIGRL